MCVFPICDLMVIQDVREVAQYLEFKIILQWMDAIVFYYNIKPDEEMNSLTLDEHQHLSFGIQRNNLEQLMTRTVLQA